MKCSTRFSVGGALLAALLALTVAGPAAAAGRRHSMRCDQRRGTVWLEDRAARVYSRHGELYACGRRSPRRSHRLFAVKEASSHQVSLAGRFVAWIQGTPDGMQAWITVLDTSTGRSRRTSSVPTADGGIAAFVVTSDGTVVSLAQIGSRFNPHSSILSVNSGGADTVLDHNANFDSYPVKSFGVSGDGHTVFWADNGQLRSAAIP